MNTQRTSNDSTRRADRAGGHTLDSILRSLTVAVALLVFGFSAQMVVADHMGNQNTPVDEPSCVEASESTPAAIESSTAVPFDMDDFDYDDYVGHSPAFS